MQGGDLIGSLPKLLLIEAHERLVHHLRSLSLCRETCIMDCKSVRYLSHAAANMEKSRLQDVGIGDEGSCQVDRHFVGRCQSAQPLIVILTNR